MAHKVLVVDDEPNILLSLEFLLTEAGFDVRAASDGEAALQSIAVDPPDVVLLDVNMPRKNGYEVCETVRASPAWRNVRIIMLTTKGRPSEPAKAFTVGADMCVTKPFAPQEVIQQVRDLLRIG